MKTLEILERTQVQQAKRARFNPLSSLGPTTLARYLNAFEAGYLREAACVWDALEQRDDLLRTVISKRKKAVGRQGWTVLPKIELSPEQKPAAAEHVRALEYFYSHLECEHAVDSAEQGGFRLLTRQMMDAVGKRFAVHEIVWRAESAGDANRGFVTAKFRFVPLAFFENTTGRLRFVQDPSMIEGRELEPGAWMITTGEGLMAASSTAWMFKHLALDDWLKCSHKNGTPGLRGISGAARDSDEWNALERSLEKVLNGEPIVHATSDDLQVIDLLPRGTMPFPQLVERVDRLLAALWRGADLSTLSRDRGYGASLQEKETCALEEDDAEMLTETLNRYVDQWVIRYVFGENVKPLAHVKVLASPRECTTADIQIDQFLLQSGAPLSLQETMNRYGRALPKPDEAILISSATTSPKKFATTENRRDLQASYPESSYQNREGSGMAMNNTREASWGPSVIFRDSSPAAPTPNPNLNPTPNLLSPSDSPAAPEANRLGVRVRLRLGGEESQNLSNDFALLQPDWLQLTPYGDFPHARGLQRVDRAAADAMVAQFNSFRGRLGRLFGGVPFYIGHPDLPHTSELADRKAYGWVNQLEARDDGLYGLVKWSDAGLDLLKNAHFKYLSPFWEAREIGNENGRRIYQPVALVSVGLTNQPNIPVKPLANSLEEEPQCSADKAAEAESYGVPPSGGNGVETTRVNAELHTVRPIPSFPKMHTESLTNNLGARRSELVLIHNRRDRIQEAVLAKVRLGLAYDQAWQSVKREQPTWFE